MDLTERIYLYCERGGPDLWAEPVNALTNLAFLLGAWIMWRRAERGAVRLLSAELAAIGLASLVFHLTALAWAGALDSLTIAIFALTYLYLANRHFVGLGPALSAVGAALSVPLTVALVPVFETIPWIAISAEYWTLPVLFALYGLGLIWRLPGVGLGLLGAGALLSVSILVRSADRLLCPRWALGTHFGWHLLNALLLTGLIWLLQRHLARRTGGR